ncbi:hypothetical protein B0T25DRAFT_540593 [Lasiosphaeria hispida]|uniref:Uncharacterized protein n=1 Tax=Lasiosphaeria hispida TaxID=260671 RepID=A0AAJ0MGM0_9PEZI|nr:hypothetical protein B0T25DRAFT_540593 [Lasiosphaeria hispida]
MTRGVMPRGPSCLLILVQVQVERFRRPSQLFICIIVAESVAVCYSALARTGGRYACLEGCPGAWRTRRAVKAKEAMGFQVLGTDMELPMGSGWWL